VRRSSVKSLSRVLLAVYSAILAWLILFKFSVHVASALHYGSRSVNLVPFSSSSGSADEIVANVVVFIPFGLLLALNFKQLNLRRSLLVVLAVSLTAEIVQYIFAIGASDITDVITNTAGGLTGLTAYRLGTRLTDQDRLDRFIVTAGSALLVLVLLLLGAVEFRHGIRYHSPHTNG
jgi:glycopeptide antibiotics resistance protein